ncbi:hypothetical protein [Sphingobacterium sp.]|uniref:hypothetical protein n=1 Tax=Sphingobacterium sp. TaxID=341027 RepID=UPI0028ADF37A|nr:hypothetical protein [Sphingobacterium sp.]
MLQIYHNTTDYKSYPESKTKVARSAPGQPFRFVKLIPRNPAPFMETEHECADNQSQEYGKF